MYFFRCTEMLCWLRRDVSLSEERKGNEKEGKGRKRKENERCAL